VHCGEFPVRGQPAERADGRDQTAHRQGQDEEGRQQQEEGLQQGQEPHAFVDQELDEPEDLPRHQDKRQRAEALRKRHAELLQDVPVDRPHAKTALPATVILEGLGQIKL